MIILFIGLCLIPVFAGSSLASYAEMQKRQETPYLLHNAECVSFDGVIWTRNYGMKEYFISLSMKDIKSGLLNLRSDGTTIGRHRLVKIELNDESRNILEGFSVKIPPAYPFSEINVLLPDIYYRQLQIPCELLDYDVTRKPESGRTGSREVIYEQGFEENLGNEYEIDGWLDQPHIIIRNICWGIVDCASYDGDRSLWCAADLYAAGWYNYPPTPCSSYTNWIWSYFARLETIDVTVAEELVFEWWSAYAADPAGVGDWCRVYVIDYPTTDWTLIAEYNGYQPWVDFQLELEGMSNFAYYFDFESDEMEFSGGVYLDNISIYNMIPNLTYGEESAIEYPYDYSTLEPHNLRYAYEILNDSNVDVEDSFEVEFLLSLDNEYSTDDDNFTLGEVIISQTIPAGESILDEIVFNLDTVNIPGVGSLPEDDYYVMFFIDSQEEIDESDEEDNLAVTSGTIAYGTCNLIAGDQCSVTYPATANSSQLQIDAQVINDGNEPTNDYFEIGYMLSADDDITTTGDNYTLGYGTISQVLQPGASAYDTFTIDLEDTEVPVDDYWVFIFIDVNNAISESNENDNVWLSDAEIDYTGAAYLTLDPTDLQFEAAGGAQSIDLSSNIAWLVTNSSSWFSVSPLTGSGDNTLVVNCLENTVPTPRTQSFTVSGGNITVTVIIDQEAGTNINYGDVNDSGDVDSYDAALTLQYVVGIPTGIDPFPVIVADVDGNGEVSAYDAGLIMQYVVGIINSFPVENIRREDDSGGSEE